MVSVGIVAERDYLFNGSTKDHAKIFEREIKNNAWIEEHLSVGEQVGSIELPVNILTATITVRWMAWSGGDARDF